jgi:hypothetical protein
LKHTHPSSTEAFNEVPATIVHTDPSRPEVMGGADPAGLASVTGEADTFDTRETGASAQDEEDSGLMGARDDGDRDTDPGARARQHDDLSLRRRLAY